MSERATKGERERLWLEDPSPSYNEIARWAGIDAPLTSPEEPPGDIYKQAEALWPAVPSAAQPVPDSGENDD